MQKYTNALKSRALIMTQSVLQFRRRFGAARDGVSTSNRFRKCNTLSALSSADTVFITRFWTHSVFHTSSDIENTHTSIRDTFYPLFENCYNHLFDDTRRYNKRKCNDFRGVLRGRCRRRPGVYVRKTRRYVVQEFNVLRDGVWMRWWFSSVFAVSVGKIFPAVRRFRR